MHEMKTHKKNIQQYQVYRHSIYIYIPTCLQYNIYMQKITLRPCAFSLYTGYTHNKLPPVVVPSRCVYPGWAPWTLHDLGAVLKAGAQWRCSVCCVCGFCGLCCLCCFVYSLCLLFGSFQSVSWKFDFWICLECVSGGSFQTRKIKICHLEVSSLQVRLLKLQFKLGCWCIAFRFLDGVNLCNSGFWCLKMFIMGHVGVTSEVRWKYIPWNAKPKTCSSL